jgi:hypothetical protein
MKDTSLMAYSTIYPFLGERQSQIVDALHGYGFPMNNAMLSKMLSLPINQITGRTNELVKKGIVEDIGKHRCPISGRATYFWVLKDVPK